LFLPSTVSVSPSPAHTHFHPSINAQYSIMHVQDSTTSDARAFRSDLKCVWVFLCAWWRSECRSPTPAMQLQHQHTHTRTQAGARARIGVKGLVAILKIPQGRFRQISTEY